MTTLTRHRPPHPTPPGPGPGPRQFDPRDLHVVLRRRRRDLRMSQRQVAERLGYSRELIGQWERGVADPHWTNALRWAAVLGVNILALEEPGG